MFKLVGLILLAGYVFGIWKFWTGYGLTNFNRSFPVRITLSLLWPVLVLMNASYRKNFVKILKGGN